MIPVPKLTLENQPALFDTNCREPGAAWLQAYPTKDPHEQSNWWSQFKPDLARHFSHLCGWQATSIGLDGVVEHWLSCGHRKASPSPNRHLAFEWINYRYSTGVVNSLKGTFDDQILDPCDVKSGWFEVLLPSFQLVVTNRLPKELETKAELTLNQLQLRRGHHARWTRWSWYRRYWNDGAPDVVNLRIDAPLVAVAVEKAQASGHPLPNPNDCLQANEIEARHRSWGRRRRRILEE